MYEELKLSERIINTIRDFLKDSVNIRKYCMRKEDFTRERSLTFWRSAVLILVGWKMSLQNRINKFFKELGSPKQVVSSSAFCQSRQKLKPEFFKAVNKELLNTYYDEYEKEGLVKRWNGRLIWGVDGSYINLPNKKELREKYLVQKNEYGEFGVQGLCSCVYDVLNEVIINSELAGTRSEKSFILNSHINYYKEDVIMLYDRQYTDYAVIAIHIKKGIDFVIRSPESCTFKKIEEFVNSDKIDEIVILKASQTQKKFVKEYGLPEEVKVRLLKIYLEAGKVEILMTSLLDSEYQAKDFQWLYNKRWGIETYYDRLKDKIEVERFSSEKVVGIEQDFYGLIFLTNLESVLIKEEEEKIIDKNNNNSLKYKYKINKSVSYSVLTNYTVELFLDESKTPLEILEELKVMFRKNLVPERPGRRFPRKEKTPSQRLRFYRYFKKVWT